MWPPSAHATAGVAPPVAVVEEPPLAVVEEVSGLSGGVPLAVPVEDVEEVLTGGPVAFAATGGYATGGVSIVEDNFSPTRAGPRASDTSPLRCPADEEEVME